MITIVSGVPGCGAPLVLNMLEAGGLPVMPDTDMPPVNDDPSTFSVPPSFMRSAPDLHWLAHAEGKACRLDWTHLVHLPASREFRIVFMHRNLNDLISHQPPVTAAGGGRPDRPAEVVYQALERQLYRVTRWLDGPRQMAVQYFDTETLVTHPMTVIRELEAFLGLRLNRHAMIVMADRRRLDLATPSTPLPDTTTVGAVRTE